MTNLGLQMFSLREYMKTPEDFGATLKKIKKIGYNAVQLCSPAPMESALVRAALDESGLVCPTTHFSHDEMMQDIDKVIATNKAWGAKYVGCAMLPFKLIGSKEGFEQFVVEATDIVKRLEDAGLKYVYHNHHFEFLSFGGKTGYDIIVEGLPEEAMLEVDTYWLQSAGADPIYWINKLAGRLDVIHFKDMEIAPNEPSPQSRMPIKAIMAPVGCGNLNWEGIVEASKKAGVKWYIVEQDMDGYGRDMFDAVELSYNFLVDRFGFT